MRWIISSIVVLEESPWTNLQVLVLGPKVLENFQGLCILQTVRYVWSCYVHKFCYRHRAWGYGEECLTYWYMTASKPFFTVTQWCCPWGKSLSLSLRTNFKSLSLDLKSLSFEPQVLVLGPWAIHPWLQHWLSGALSHTAVSFCFCLLSKNPW